MINFGKSFKNFVQILSNLKKKTKNKENSLKLQEKLKLKSLQEI